MDIYDMVDRIIDLTEKGKIDWHSLYDDDRRHYQYTGWYKEIRIVLHISTTFPLMPVNPWPKKEIELEIQGTVVIIDKKQAQRLQRAVERATSETKRKIDADKLQRAYDILRG